MLAGGPEQQILSSHGFQWLCGLQKCLMPRTMSSFSVCKLKLRREGAFSTSTYMAAPMIAFDYFRFGQCFGAFDPQPELSHGWDRHHTCPPGIVEPYTCDQSSGCPVILLVGSHVQKIPKLTWGPPQCQLVYRTSLETWNRGNKGEVIFQQCH